RAPTAIGEDPALVAAGFTRPRASRVRGVGSRFADRATDLLADALDQALAELSSVRPGWRDERVGVCIGTSSGGMLRAEAFFAELAAGAPPTDPASATYFAPLDDALDAAGIAPVKRCQVLAACASSTIAIGLG